MNAYVGCINRLSARAYRFTRALFQLGGEERPHRQRADHLRHLHHLRHIAIAGKTSTRPTRWSRTTRRSKLPPRPTRRPSPSSSRCSRRPTIITPQENYKDDKMAKGKALHPRLVAAWDAFASRRPETARRRRSHQRQTRAGETRRDRAERRPQGALLCRGADDPGQARAARGGHGDKPDLAAIAQALTEYEETVKAPSRIRAPTAAARSARSSSATPSRSWSRQSS